MGREGIDVWTITRVWGARCWRGFDILRVYAVSVGERPKRYENDAINGVGIYMGQPPT